MNVRSMTGFAGREGAAAGWRWRWEARCVNARGLDLRLRLGEGWESLEPEPRRRAIAGLKRGAVSITFRADEQAGPARLAPHREAQAAAVRAACAARDATEAAGLPTAPVAPERLLALRGVLADQGRRFAVEDSRAEAGQAALADFDALLGALEKSRAAERAALGAALSMILDATSALSAEADVAHVIQTAAVPTLLREKVAALPGAGAEIAPERHATELAQLAVKADVREELDRLRTHVGAARSLLARGGSIWRELDFLTQEFNREANTLCAKAASGALTQAGLALKVRIDQLRDQAQNIE